MPPALLARPPPAANTATRSATPQTDGQPAARRSTVPLLPLYLLPSARRMLPQGTVAARRELDASPAPTEQATETSESEQTPARTGEQQRSTETESQRTGAQEAQQEAEVSTEAAGEAAGGEAAAVGGAQEEASARGEEAAVAGEGGPAEGEEAAAAVRDGAEQEAAAADAAAPARGAARAGREPPPPPLPVIPIPRLGGIRMPRVPSPPQSALRRRGEILAQTGSTPEVHHGLVAQAVLRVVEAARTAQRDIVWRVGNLALNARMSIEDLALEVPRLVGNAIGIVRAAVRQTLAAVRTSAETQISHIEANKGRIVSDFAATRTQVMGDIRTHLRDGSTALREADTALQAQFTAHLGAASTQIKQIPENGTFAPLNLPPMRGAAAAPPAAPAEAVRPGNLTQAEEDIRSALTGTEGKAKLRVWQDIKCADVLPAVMAQRKTAMLAAAEARANELGGEATRGEFARISFGLVAPTAQAAEDDAEGDAPRAQNKVEGEQRQVRTAADQAIDSLRDKLKGVENALDPNRPKTAPFQVEKGLREAGDRIVKMLRQQARATEAGIRASAAAMADAYPDMVERVKPLLSEGQLLDSGERVPRLAKARDGIARVHASQVATVRERANAAVDDARTALLAQGRSLTDMANNGARSIRDMVIPATFDFELVGALYVDPMNAGARLVTDRVIGYAERVAEGLMRPMTEADNGVSVVERTAVGFLNSNITGEHRGFLAQIAAIKDDLEKEDQIFPTIRDQVRTDLAARSSKLSGMLTSGSFGGAAASTVMGGGVGLVVYLAMTDADDEGATGVIGELPWPGAPALEEVFLSETSETLRDRIANASLSDAQRQRLLNLLSENARTRREERERIAADSAGIFTGPPRGVREQVLRGMGAEERATMSPAQLEQMQASLRASLRGTELAIAIGYTEGNPGQVLAARMQERLDAANRGTEDATVLAMDEIEQLARVELGGSYGAAFVHPSQIQAEVNAMYPEFERLTAAPGTPAATRDRRTPLSPTEMTRARESFIAYATRPHIIYVGQHEPIEVPVSDRVRDVVTTVAMHGSGSREAWVARAGYEVARAESEARAAWTGSLSSETQARVTRHSEDPMLARAHREVDRLQDQLRTAPPGRREAIRRQLEAERRGLAAAQTEHDTRMGLLATNLDPTADVREPGAGTRLVAQRVGGIFARGDEEDRRYGTELITQGRASMAAGVRLAVRGLGTNEELLGMVTANRSHLEIRQANREYKELHGESMTAAIYDDVSGDLALQMELALEGEPENDQDRLRLAAIRHRQETVSGTGFIARQTMADTWQLELINRRRSELGDTLLQSALAEARRTNDTEAVAWLSTLPPGKIYDARGNVIPGVARFAFDEDGNLHGDAAGLAFNSAVSRLNSAADSYRAEIDRQESMMTSFITGLAIALSVVLLVVPGVNLIAAGVLTALIAGAATIAVKAGMRGGRYGWEEMATDAAMTAVEAVTAGAGGAMAGGLGKAGLAAKFASVGNRLNTAFGGRVGGTIAREAIVAAVNHSAQTAMQDETWNRGLERGLLRVAGSAARGAALGGVTAGVSARLQGRLTSALGNAEKSGVVQRLGRTLGTSGQNVVAEAVSQSLGATAGEAAGVLVGRVTGQSHGSWRDDLRQIGQAGLRDLLTGAGRAGVQNANRARYQQKLAEARATVQPTPEQMRSLRLAAISAGVHIGGAEATYDLSMATLQREVAVGRAALSGLPPSLARHLAGADEATLIAANRMLASGEAGSPQGRAAFLAQLAAARGQFLVGDFDPATVTRDLEAAHNAIHASDAPPAAGSAAHAQARAARGIIVSELEGPVRGALRDLPMEGLAGAPEAVLRGAAAMVARGTFDPAVASALLKAARAANPHLDAAAFNRNLIAAVETGRIAVATRKADLARRREALLEAAPEEARAAIRALPNAEMERLSRRLERGEAGNRQQRDAMLRTVPPEHRAALESALDAMAATASARIDQARVARRAARLEWLGDVPEELRSALSTLPDHALLGLQAAHVSGEAVTPERRTRMVADALRETPAADGASLRKAIDGMLALPRPAAEANAALRAELLAAIPPAERHLVADVPLLVMDDAAFAAFTRSRKGDAVTLIIDGRPVVVMRRGADPQVLQEEGLHVLQARSPAIARRAAMLDERTMAEWDTLPLARQMELYRAKLGLEIDAHENLLASIEARARNASPEQAMQLARQRMVAEESLANLRRRQTEVAGVSALQQARIAAGLEPRPDWLDQPARLFGKKTGPLPAPEKVTLGDDFRENDTETERALGQQMANLRQALGDAAADGYLQKVRDLAKALGKPELAAEVVQRLEPLNPADLHAAVDTLTRLAGIRDKAGHAAIDFVVADLPPRTSVESVRQTRLAAARDLLDTINVNALASAELRRDVLKLIESSRKEDQGSNVKLKDALNAVTEAIRPATVPVGDDVLARAMLDGLTMTKPGPLKTHTDAIKALRTLEGSQEISEVTVRNLLAISSMMPDPGQFLKKVAVLADRVKGDPQLAKQFAEYVRLAASAQEKESVTLVGADGTTSVKDVAPDDLRAALQTMGSQDSLDTHVRNALMAFNRFGQRGVELRLEAAKKRFDDIRKNPKAASPAAQRDYALAKDLVDVMKAAGHPGGEAEAMLLAQNYRGAIDFLVPRLASDPFYGQGTKNRSDLLKFLLDANEGLTGEALVDGLRRALRQRQMDYVLSRPTMEEQLQVLRGMDAEESMLATDRWGKGKLFELYLYMRAGGDYVAALGKPGEFVHQEQTVDLNSIKGFTPAESQARNLSGDPSRSGDGVLRFDGDPNAPKQLQEDRNYLIDTKAGSGAFKEDQFTRYVIEQLRGDPVSMTPDGHAGLIYIADTTSNAHDARARAIAQLQVLMNDPNFKVGNPPRRLTEADLSRLRIFFATYDANGKLTFEPVTLSAVQP